MKGAILPYKTWHVLLLYLAGVFEFFKEKQVLGVHLPLVRSIIISTCYPF